VLFCRKVSRVVLLVVLVAQGVLKFVHVWTYSEVGGMAQSNEVDLGSAGTALEVIHPCCFEAAVVIMCTYFDHVRAYCSWPFV
jgi:hypothetical protein